MKHLSLAAFAVLWAICAGPASARVVLVKEAHFKVEVPDAWEVSRRELAADKRSWVVHLASEGRKLRMRIRATPVSGQVNLEAAVAAWQKSVLSRDARRFMKLDAVEKDVEGRRSLLAFYRVEMVRRTTLRRYRAVVLAVHARRGWLYLLQCFVQESAWASREAEVESVVSSFDLLGRGAEPEGEEPASPEPKLEGKTRVVADRQGLWQITVPADWTVSAFGTSAGGKARSARISSPGKNVRVFVRSRVEKGERYDYAAHFRRFARRVVQRGYFAHLEEVKSARGSGEVEGRTGAWRAYRAYGKRVAGTHPYRLVTVVAHSARLQRVFTVTLAAHRDHFERHHAAMLAIIESFGPIAAAGK